MFFTIIIYRQNIITVFPNNKDFPDEHMFENYMQLGQVSFWRHVAN